MSTHSADLESAIRKLRSKYANASRGDQAYMRKFGVSADLTPAEAVALVDAGWRVQPWCEEMARAKLSVGESRPFGVWIEPRDSRRIAGAR